MRSFRVHGNSMYPFLRSEDLLVVSEIPPNRLKRGNLVVFRSYKQNTVVHRVISNFKGEYLYVRGDGFGLKKELIRGQDVLGKVTGIIRGGNFIPLTRKRELFWWAVSILKEWIKKRIYLMCSLKNQ
ncbi:MAG: hypothetical protein DRG69_07230 [Deltaproteobacteria bacterium]|nr:MAG: hypothetical protein DRG69_07230 [Deltaproteobacteria bacterium]